MNIGIIGAGHIGGTLAKLFIAAGHKVRISNSRGPETLTELVRQLGPSAEAATVMDAASFDHLVVEAIPYGRYHELPGEALEGRVLISASNYYPQRDGTINLGDDAQTEHLAKSLPGVRVIKAFNAIRAADLETQGDTAKPEEQRRAIFIAGDDAQAKELVENLVREIGFGPVDTGSLHHSKVLEPGSNVYTVQLSVAEARRVLAGD